MHDARPPLERLAARVFGDAEDTRAGTGWMSGTAGVFFGGLALLGVLAFRFPGLLSTPELRAHYPVPLLRAALEATIGAGFLLGSLSLMLRRRKVLGLTALGLALGATLLGGGGARPASDVAPRLALGLDWFLLNLLLLALVFVPLERAFPRRPRQGAFRLGWTTDGAHFLVSHVAVQVLTFLTLLPASALARVAAPPALHAFVSGLPLAAQVAAAVVVADLAQYGVHRAFHRVPLLWRFHAVHHSSRALDWLAGSRLHPVDAVATRALVLVPLFLLGFSTAALGAYAVLVAFHAVFIHANFGVRFGWLDHVIATPRVHHWHHAVSPTDVNFAVHLPVLDRLFGTQHLPPGDAWPDEHGIAGHPVPEGWLAQFAWPFRRRARAPHADGDERARGC